MHILISALSRFTRPTGICRHAVNLARCVSDYPEIEKVTLLVGQWQERYFRTAFDIDPEKIVIEPILIKNDTLTRNLWFTFGLPGVVARLKPDIVHLAFPVPIFRARILCPVMVTVHDLYPFEAPNDFLWFNGICKRAFTWQCLRACDGVACVSESTRKSLIKKFPWLSSRIPVRVVRNYADLPLSAEAPQFESDLRPFLLTVAQHQPNKRLDLLILALSQLLQEGRVDKNLQLFVVGSDGARSEALRALITSLNLDSHVKWVPQLSDRELAWMYRNCEIFIASSSMEGFCLPLLEALILNCRVVASDIPVFREIAGSAPIYFDISQNPVENLANAVVKAIQSPSCEGRFILQFSRSRTGSECMALYSYFEPNLVQHKERGATSIPIV